MTLGNCEPSRIQRRKTCVKEEGKHELGRENPGANAKPMTTILWVLMIALGCGKVGRVTASLALESDVGLCPRPPKILWVTLEKLIHF